MIDSNGREMRTDMSYIKLFPYVFFGCTVLGAMGNMLWFSQGYHTSQFMNHKLINYESSIMTPEL